MPQGYCIAMNKLLIIITLNTTMNNYYYNHLNKPQHPVACISARHSSSLAKNASLDDMSRLEPVVFLAKAAKVTLTMNLWSHVGLCNRATGTVRHIICDNSHHPPNLPVVVIIEFDNLRGPLTLCVFPYAL